MEQEINMNNKRGQGLSVNAIILIVLGVIVLVLMILGFTLGWGTILPFLSTSNVNNIVTSCNTACSTSSQFDFCNLKRNLKADAVQFKDVTCNYLLNNQTKYGIQSCPNLPCDSVLLLKAQNQPVLNSRCTGNEGKTVQALVGDTLISIDCPLPA
jgi:hypothetical protein